MSLKSKLMASVNTISGLATIMNSVPHHECDRNIAICSPPSIHQPDQPDRHPGPVQTTGKITVRSSATASYAFVGPEGLAIRWRSS